MKDAVQSGKIYQKIVEPGTGSRYWIIVGHDDNRVPFVALPDYKRAATMSWSKYVHWAYVAEKLQITIPDAQTVAQILNDWNPAYTEAQAVSGEAL